MLLAITTLMEGITAVPNSGVSRLVPAASSLEDIVWIESFKGLPGLQISMR